MRIIAGSRRGAKLTKLDVANTRPTADRTRESLFNILAGGKSRRTLAGANVIDAFAGTGALGLEALSRGAASVCFIEQDRAALAVLRANITKLDMQDRAAVLAGDATRLSHWSAPPAAIMFADAPYHSGAGQTAAITIGAIGGLAPGAMVILEMQKTESLDIDNLAAATITPDDTRIYGKTALHFLTYNGQSNSG